MHYECGKNMLSQAYLPYHGESRRLRISQHGLLSAHTWPAFRQNKSRDPEGPVPERVVRDYSRRMAWRQERCSGVDAPLLQHARRADNTRWADLQREFCHDTQESSRRYEDKDSLIPTQKKSMSEACMLKWNLQYISANETHRELNSTKHTRETLMSHEVPSRPWEKIATVFSLDGKDYLVTIDYYSNFWEVDRLPNTKASTTILKLKSHFARYGIPDKVISDGCNWHLTSLLISWECGILNIIPVALEIARPMARPSLGWRQWSASWRNQSGLGPTHTSPYDYRNTTSPAQCLMSRRTMTLLPTTQSLLLSRAINLENEKKELRQRQQAQAKYYRCTTG